MCPAVVSDLLSIYIWFLVLSERFTKVLQEQQQDRARREQERIRLLTADPFDLEAQAKIEEDIRWNTHWHAPKGHSRLGWRLRRCISSSGDPHQQIMSEPHLWLLSQSGCVYSDVLSVSPCCLPLVIDWGSIFAFWNGWSTHFPTCQEVCHDGMDYKVIKP